MSEKSKTWMIYGANGYTGRKIVAAAHRAGLRPILAGRDSEEITTLGARYQLPMRIFPCQNDSKISPYLEDVGLVLHCAGPFSTTASPMAKACMRAHCHYLDITGEIAVFEKILTRSADFQKAGIVAIPGVGFDVVPSDCLAAMLQEKLPDATSLEMILKPKGGFSPGTLKTMLEGFYVGTVIRRAGRIQMTNDFVTAEKFFNKEKVFTVGIAWGDIASAFYTTGIPNISIFLISNQKNVCLLRIAQKFRWLWKIPWVQNLLKFLVDWKMPGPTEADINKNGYEIWGTVRNSKGQSVSLGISTPNGYAFTVDSSLAAVHRLLDKAPAPGAYTPAQAFGKDFARHLPKVEIFG